jgi:hypothetical protein
LTRGSALVSADNNKKMFLLKEKGKVRINKSRENAFIVRLW